MVDMETKRGRWKYKKFESLENKKSFSDEIKHLP